MAFDQSTEPTSAEKFARQLVAYFSTSRAGLLVLDALADNDVTEVYLNRDEELWNDTYSTGAGGDVPERHRHASLR